tara:strand:- start:205 stop:540 length:336 start_codon:yes stop_codon:yes gene_type:complete
MVDSGVMNGVDVRTPTERMTDVECRALYNKIVCKLTNAKFHTTPKDKAMLDKLRECELYLRELSLYSDLIYQRQVKEGNDENEELLRLRERDVDTEEKTDCDDCGCDEYDE